MTNDTQETYVTVNFPSIRRFRCQSLWSIEWNPSILHGSSWTDRQLTHHGVPHFGLVLDLICYWMDHLPVYSCYTFVIVLWLFSFSSCSSSSLFHFFQFSRSLIMSGTNPLIKYTFLLYNYRMGIYIYTPSILDFLNNKTLQHLASSRSSL